MMEYNEAMLAAEVLSGLYIHIPFCETKCGYCDFYSVAVKDRETGPLVARVIRELEIRVGPCADRIRTIFCGGGTPTILPVGELRALLDAIGGVVRLDRIEEFTVEANPATVDDDKAALLVGRGVSRVSMGAQSFFPTELEALERIHSPGDIGPSVATLRRHGVRQVNLDLIFGIPGQAMTTWADSLARAVDLAPDHIACYGLTYEPGTRLTAQHRAGRIQACDEHLEAEMYLYAVDALDRAGYEQYEISNFARPGCACRHNLIYWRNGPYIGVGPSAAGCINGRRYKNISDVAGYIRMIDERGHAEAESEPVEGETLIYEMLLMQLRLNEGLSVVDFKSRTGFDPFELFGSTLGGLIGQGLMAASQGHLSLTREGRLMSNRIMAELASVVRVEAKHGERGIAGVRLPILT
jgi:oxygen-independent coproporphyrinogen III oxidase